MISNWYSNDREMNFTCVVSRKLDSSQKSSAIDRDYRTSWKCFISFYFFSKRNKFKFFIVIYRVSAIAGPERALEKKTPLNTFLDASQWLIYYLLGVACERSLFVHRERKPRIYSKLFILLSRFESKFVFLVHNLNLKWMKWISRISQRRLDTFFSLFVCLGKSSLARDSNRRRRARPVPLAASCPLGDGILCCIFSSLRFVGVCRLIFWIINHISSSLHRTPKQTL